MNTDYLNALLGPDGCLTMALAEGEAVVLGVIGDCMQPEIGHLTSVRLERQRFFMPGDIVVFYCARQRRLLLHRLLGYVWRRGAWKALTMPDRGIRPDPLMDASQVLGKVIERGGKAYRVAPARRLEALMQYIKWCARRLATKISPTL